MRELDPKELLDRTSLGISPLSESELPDDASIFEVLVAAPDDEELHTIWTVWSIVFALYSFIILVVFFAIISSKRVRRQPFNHYLIYLMLPDILYTVLCTIQCGALAITGGNNTPASCRLQSFYLLFGNGANSWMNALIANQIHTLLKVSNRCGRYVPPTRRKIALQSRCAYAWAAFIAILGILPESVGIPIMTVPFYGLGCVAVSYDRASNLFFWLFFYPAFAAIPMLYLIYVTVDIWRKKLLPREGRRREISLYYVRILVAVYVMWFPALVTIYGFSVGAWPFMYAGLWIHAQGAVSALCSLMKDDIYRAVRHLLTCRCSEESKEEQSSRNRGGPTSRSSSFDDILGGSSHLGGVRRTSGTKRELQTRNFFLYVSGFFSTSQDDSLCSLNDAAARSKVSNKPMSLSSDSGSVGSLGSRRSGAGGVLSLDFIEEHSIDGSLHDSDEETDDDVSESIRITPVNVLSESRRSTQSLDSIMQGDSEEEDLKDHSLDV